MRTPPNERVNPDIADKGSSPKTDQASGSERRCILSGESHPRESLVRLAISPAGEVLPDPGARAPGRGAWIAPDRAALESAIAEGHLKRALMRAFKGGPEGTTLSYSDDLPQQVEMALTRHLTDRLGLELRAGNIVLGSSRIEEQARAGRIALLLHASDSSEGSRKRLDQAWRVGSDLEGSGRRGLVLPLDRDTLSVALGRENVVHLGVSGQPTDLQGSNPARAATRVAQAANRLSRFVSGNSAACEDAMPAETCDDR
ncbi:DUF448 domain-containing protein [Erythrobacter sp. THAF29]|uniref:DUF448 domain-containing protein n=1 Tax=Erythrobacter sp. THAF29 TaxID=2587851 RepID=UPI001268CD3B|nr:DUF448 domain-containing protein [Erythrobacter sp. THAF29]QFT78562.1 hypothetical protein FIU90_13515 [Erythrobacter sp. THAF29]